MRAYVEAPQGISRGIVRVADALKKYAPPDIECAPTMDEADFVLIHTIGWEGELAARLLAQGKQIGFFMYCLRTTQRPNAKDWVDLWRAAAITTSYYDLPLLAFEDGVRHLAMNFLHTPLGVDTAIFHPPIEPIKDPYLVGTSGYVDGMEIISEWAWVAGANGGRMFHLGPHLKLPNAAVQYRTGITDEELAGFWGRCRYVSGLRRTEGFELPALEGLACGARPVMFDREDAWQWFGPHAEYIGEGDDALIRFQLDTLIRGKYRPVTPDEVVWVKETFTWKAMAEKFWGAIQR